MTEEQKLLKEALDLIEELLEEGVFYHSAIELDPHNVVGGIEYKNQFEELVDKIDTLLTPKRKLNP